MSALVSRLNTKELLDEYFIENRNRLLDLAAFLDRLDRVPADDKDFRQLALGGALRILADGKSERVPRIQMLLSDLTSEPLEKLDRKSAIGASDRWSIQPEARR